MEKEKEIMITEENQELCESEKGASMLEYALLAALIAVVAIAAIAFLGVEASTTFSHVGEHISGTRN